MQESLKANLRLQAMFWVAFLVLFTGFLWLLNDILLPFLAGMALAYFLDPVADWFEKKGTSRLVAVTIILLLFVLLFITSLVVVVPVLGNQISGFLERLPSLVSQLQSLLTTSQIGWLRDMIDVEDGAIQDNLNPLITEGAGWLTTVLKRVWAGGQALLDVVSLLVVTPVVAFYLLLDWDNMIARIDGWLPLKQRATIRGIMRDIDGVVAGFVRGQGTVCIILGIFYAVALTLIGVNFGLLIGLFSGLISFIPFVGSIVGFLLAIGVSLVQFWPEWIPILLAAGVFVFGQFVEGNFLQPNLVGNSVGLHPVWLMFALFAFGSLLGFTGMLIAVPTAAAIGVVVRFALSRYLESELYHGEVPQSGALEDNVETKPKTDTVQTGG